MATRRRRFAAAFKKRVALDALPEGAAGPGDRGQTPSSSEPSQRLEAPGRGGPGRGVFGPAVEGSFGARGDDPRAAREERGVHGGARIFFRGLGS